jgi:hypothetical protein
VGSIFLYGVSAGTNISKLLSKAAGRGLSKKWIQVDMHVEPPWVNKLLFPPAIKDQWKEPPMTDRIAGASLSCAWLGSRRATAPKNFIFGGFAPSVTGKLWLLNPPGWPILAVILCPVTSLYSLLTLNATFITI